MLLFGVDLNPDETTHWHGLHHGLPNPALYPLRAPGGVRVSRRLPQEPGAEPLADHPHHRSLWFAHGSLNGIDFWQGDGRIDALGAEHERRGQVHDVRREVAEGLDQ